MKTRNCAANRANTHCYVFGFDNITVLRGGEPRVTRLLNTKWKRKCGDKKVGVTKYNVTPAAVTIVCLYIFARYTQAIHVPAARLGASCFLRGILYQSLLCFYFIKPLDVSGKIHLYFSHRFTPSRSRLHTLEEYAGEKEKSKSSPEKSSLRRKVSGKINEWMLGK